MLKRSTNSLKKKSYYIPIVLGTFAFLCISFSSFSQSRTISGVVKSTDDNVTVAGANVVVKGTAIGTITDVNGKYSLSIPQEAEALIFSFIGLSTKEVAIGDLSVIDVGLDADSKELAEIVVTALGMERDKKSLGFAVQAVNGEVLTKAPSASVVNSLSGRVAGMQVISSSVPGGSPEFVVRGFASVSGNNQPLIVVDGVPMAQTVNATNADRTSNQRYGGGISELDPNSIAELSVLKGPTAAALYGSRAANGVILIKTKSGAGTTGLGVELNFSTSFEKPLVKPKFQNIYGGGSGGRTWYADGRSGTVDGEKGTAGTDESWGSPMDGRLVRHWWSGTELYPLTPEPDNWEQRWDTGKTTSTNVALTGASDKGSFRLSVGRMDQDAIVYNNNYYRNNFRLNATHQFTDKLSLSVMGEYIKSGSDNRSFLGDQSFIWHHRQTNYDKLRNYKDYMDAHIQVPGDTDPPNWQHTFFTNPYFLEEVVVRPNEKDRFLGNIALTYEITPSLSLLLRSGTDFWTDTRISVTQFERIRTGNLTRGSYNEEVLRRQETNSDFILTYTKELASNFTVLAQAGGANRMSYYKRNYTNVQQLTIDRVYTTGNNAIPNVDESEIQEVEVNSLFGSAQFGFKDYLFLDVTGRNDWSSTLPSANRSFFYPSVAVSAVLTEMLGIKDNVLSFAKVRANWAKVGSGGDVPYQTQQVYEAKGLYDGSTPKFSENKKIAQPNLKPESTTGIEFGAELKFLKGRIGLDATYYDQSTKDQIVAVDISKASGYNSLVLNAGEITNKGVEVTLSGTVVKLGNGFTWDIAFNFAKNRSQVVELAEGLTSLTLWTQRGASLEARVGEAYGNLYGNKFARADDGQIIYTNGLPTNLAGQHTIGNITPDWMGGISNSFKYKGFNLSMLIDVKAGGDIYDMGTSLARVTGVLEESGLAREEGTIGQGVKNIGTTESPNYVPNDVVAPTKQFMGYYNGRAYHEAAVFDGSYVKIRELTLSYSLPANLFSDMFIKSVSVALTGRNLAILFKNTVHVDPEVSSADLGYNYGQLPSVRSLGFNVNVKF